MLMWIMWCKAAYILDKKAVRDYWVILKLLLDTFCLHSVHCTIKSFQNTYLLASVDKLMWAQAACELCKQKFLFSEEPWTCLKWLSRHEEVCKCNDILWPQKFQKEFGYGLSSGLRPNPGILFGNCYLICPDFQIPCNSYTSILKFFI